MGTVIAVANQKGGVGKTVTSGAVASILAKNHQKRVLCIDMDPQANLTGDSGAEQNDFTTSVLRGTSMISDHIQHTKNYDILASDISLSIMEVELNGSLGREQRLREAIQSDPKLEVYDYVVIDTPPNLGTLSVTSLVAADYVLIPSFADIHSLNGVAQLGATIKSIRKFYNRNLSICGIVITRSETRTNLNKVIRDAAEDLASQIDTKVYQAMIRKENKVPEASVHRMNLIDYISQSKALQDYSDLVDEMLQDFAQKGTEKNMEV